jgi:DNA primase
LGTSLTDEQASQLARLGSNPIVVTDGDIAGRVAADATSGYSPALDHYLRPVSQH